MIPSITERSAWALPPQRSTKNASDFDLATASGEWADTTNPPAKQLRQNLWQENISMMQFPQEELLCAYVP